MDAMDRLKAWLVECKQVPPNSADGELSRLVLTHIGTKHETLSEIPVPNIGDFDPKAAAEEIWADAEDDAESIGGHQKYRVEAYFGSAKKPQRKKRFAVDATDSTDSEFTEPATVKGIISQMMRHTEASTKAAVSGGNGVVKMLVAQIERLEKRNQYLEEKIWETFEVRQQLLDRNEERQAERFILEQQEKRKDEVVETVKLLLPGAAKKISKKLGTGNGEEGDSAFDAAALKTFAESLTEEQIASLAGILKPPQQIAIMQLLQEMKDD